MNLDILSSRTTSAFPVSVGTSLALESVFVSDSPSIDPDRQIPQKIEITDYNELWINLHTLFRNAFGSLTREGSSQVLPREMVQIMEDEMEMISSIASQQSNYLVNTIFYLSQYRGHERKYPHARLRKLTTDNQKNYYTLLMASVNALVDRHKLDKSMRYFDDSLKNDNKPKALLLSHMAYDLLSVKNFQVLNLLESHTGVLRTPASWYTKYYDGKNLPPMPFSKVLMQVFGDKETFSVMDLKLKREMIELAKSCRWTPATTVDKLKNDIHKLTNPYYVTILKSMF